MSNRKKIITYSIAGILVAAGVSDAIRYLQPANKHKQVIVEGLVPQKGDELILVYNAYGGIYPGIADVIHKELFPKTYPCNLCYLSFGTFGMKQSWKDFLDSQPYKIRGIHKDSFTRTYLPKNLPLPVILISNGNSTAILVSASEINAQHTLAGLIKLVKAKLP